MGKMKWQYEQKKKKKREHKKKKKQLPRKGTNRFLASAHQLFLYFLVLS